MDKRLFFPATLRNRNCIRKVLLRVLPKNGSILEIGSGSGEHGVYFQKCFPSIDWQTSDPETSHRNSISAWISHEGLLNKMPQPIEIEITKRPWPLNSKFLENLKVIVCINVIHISQWQCTKALFEEAGKLLKKENLLILYGPFKINNKHTSESNDLFDKQLKLQNPMWGIRELEEVSNEGRRNGLIKFSTIRMPANNLMVIFKML